MMRPLLVGLCILLSWPLLGQFRLVGHVQDAQGPLSAAHVELRSERGDVQLQTYTDERGNYAFQLAERGHYHLIVSFPFLQTHRLHLDVGKDVVADTVVLREDFLQLDQVVVTATRNPILRKDAPIQSQVLDRKVFSATQSVTLSEGLSFQPGLRMETNCQNCGFTGLRMNGLEGAYSQILVDGRPIFNSLQGVYGLEQVPANMIERVEIIRSGGSALYGSSAVAGTVNIITKEPLDNRTYVSTNHALVGGSALDEVYMLGTEYSSPDHKRGFTMNGFARQRGQWDANGDGFSELALLRSSSLNAKAFFRPDDRTRWTVTGYNIYEYRRGGSNFDRAFHESDLAESTTHRILNGGLTWEHFLSNKRHKLSAYANGQRLERDSYYGAGQDPDAYGFSTDRTIIAGAQYSGEFQTKNSAKHTVIAGTEWNHNRLYDAAPAYNRVVDQQVMQTGVYLQDFVEVGQRWNLLFGGRADLNNLVAGPVFSPRVNAVYKVTADWQARVGYARGFRAPQVFDEDLHITLVGGEGLVVRNAAELAPEFSDAYTASLDYNAYQGPWSLGLTLEAFHTRLADVFMLEQVGVASSGDLLMERRNGDGAVVTGATVSPKAQYRDLWNVQGGLTLQRSLYDTPVQWSEEVENTSRAFLRTPNVYGFYVLTVNASKKWVVDLSGVYTGRMLAPHYAGYVAEDRLESTPQFFEQHVRMTYKMAVKEQEPVEWSFGVQNLANSFQNDFDLGMLRDAGYVYGPSRPRTFFVGLKAGF